MGAQCSHAPRALARAAIALFSARRRSAQSTARREARSSTSRMGRVTERGRLAWQPRIAAACAEFGHFRTHALEDIMKGRICDDIADFVWILPEVIQLFGGPMQECFECALPATRTRTRLNRAPA